MNRFPQQLIIVLMDFMDNVFYGCDKLKNVVIPDGLEKIGMLQERTKTMVKYYCCPIKLSLAHIRA